MVLSWILLQNGENQAISVQRLKQKKKHLLLCVFIILDVNRPTTSLIIENFFLSRLVSGNFGNYIPSKLGTNEDAFLGEYGVSRSSNIVKTAKRSVDKTDEDETPPTMDTNVPWSEETTPDLLFWVPKSLKIFFICVRAQRCLFSEKCM